jgi:hypothetical protein
MAGGRRGAHRLLGNREKPARLETPTPEHGDSNEEAQNHGTHLAGRRGPGLRRRRRFPVRRLDRALSNLRWQGCNPRGAWGASICCLAGAPMMPGRVSGRRRRAVLCLTPSTPRRNTSRPTGRKALNGARSRALGRTSSRTFAASSRTTALT